LRKKQSIRFSGNLLPLMRQNQRSRQLLCNFCIIVSLRKLQPCAEGDTFQCGYQTFRVFLAGNANALVVRGPNSGKS